MSSKLVNATAVLCSLLEQAKPTINGSALLGNGPDEGGHELVRERLLVLGPALAYVSCPDCGIELARVVRSVGVDQVLLYCDECGEVDAGRDLLHTYTVSLHRFVERLPSHGRSGCQLVVEHPVCGPLRRCNVCVSHNQAR